MDAKSKIQIDRYSATSGDGVTVSFLDAAVPQEGWKISLAGTKSWVRFNEVDFGRGGQKAIDVRALATKASAIEIRLDKEDGPVVGRAEVGAGDDWKVITAPAQKIPAGIHDLIVTKTGTDAIDLDWVSFK